MAWDSIYVLTEVEYTSKCGAKCSATSKATAYGQMYCLQAESIINVACRKVFAVNIAAFAALPAATRYILTAAASAWAAIQAIEYDMSGFTSRVEAEDMINTLRDDFMRNISILRDKNNQNFLMTGA
jgi:hypothetical protein